MFEKTGGSVLSCREIENLLQHNGDFKPLIENAIDPAIQLQPNGFDLTVRKIQKFCDDPGSIAFDNSERVLPETFDLQFDENDWVFLPAGSYKIILNEKVNLPRDLMAIGAPRSSLLRTGASINTAIWDAGYSGRSECLLLVLNKAGFHMKKNARVLQLVFIKLSESGKLYSGTYQNENI